MKLKAAIAPILFALLLVSCTLFLIDRFVIGVNLPAFSFLRNSKESAYTVAEEIEDLFLLNTSEYRMKLIFPFDFVDRDISWWIVKEMYEQDYQADDDQQELIDIYKACLASGFDPSVDVYDFIVLTTIVKAGINLTDADYKNSDSLIRIEQSGSGKRITLYIPDAEITEIYIDDRKPSSDNFPDAEMTPAQWGELVTFLSPRIRERVIQLGILEDAAENSRILIDKILKDSGFVEVIFTEREL